MKRGSFLKRLFGGVAAIAVTPSILEAAKEELTPLTDWIGGEESTKLWIDSSNHDVIEWRRNGADSELYVNGIKDISGNGNHFIQKAMSNQGTVVVRPNTIDELLEFKDMKELGVQDKMRWR
jgi:hypothetical protein